MVKRFRQEPSPGAPSRWHWVVAALVLVMGFLVTEQIETIQAINRTAQLEEGQLLSDLVTRTDQENGQLTNQILAVKAQLAALPVEPRVTGLSRALAANQVWAGLTPVTGAGVQVIIHDATRPDFPGEPAMLELVHDQYVLRIVSLLSAAGARAIAIDGQRYTATTSIYCAGPTIRINNVPYGSPYVISAVGPVGPMVSMLANDPDIQGWAQLVYIHWAPVRHLVIAGYNQPLHYTWAKPVKIGK